MRNEIIESIEKSDNEHRTVWTNGGRAQYAIEKQGRTYVVSAECAPDMFKSPRIKDCINFIIEDVKYLEE